MPKSGFTFPTLVTWTDPNGKTHIPPDPPLVKGYPPWFPRPNEYRREKPLKQCPSLTCRRAKRCTSLLYGEFCQKSHMDRETFRWKIVERIDAFTRAQGREPVTYKEGDPVGTPPPEMKRALQARQDELMREHLLEWQTNWISKQKNKFSATKTQHISAAE